ncbi:MAG TPA: hypothetical protein VFL67_12445 [Mycobacterium sp.]|nr:hypothetical protein [Mycobacterium sp.]
MTRIWSIRRARGPHPGSYELRPWQADDVAPYIRKPERARILAHSVVGARAMLPRGSRLLAADHPVDLTQGSEWWMDGGDVRSANS